MILVTSKAFLFHELNLSVCLFLLSYFMLESNYYEIKHFKSYAYCNLNNHYFYVNYFINDTFFISYLNKYQSLFFKLFIRYVFMLIFSANSLEILKSSKSMHALNFLCVQLILSFYPAKSVL